MMLAAFMLQAAHERIFIAAGRGRNPALSRNNRNAGSIQRSRNSSFGRGYIGDGWQRLFQRARSPARTAKSYEGGIEMTLIRGDCGRRGIRSISPPFELNSEPIYRAILAAHQRGVAVRIVARMMTTACMTSKNEALRKIAGGGRGRSVDDGRSGLMHNKFIIHGRSRRVWTGFLEFHGQWQPIGITTTYSSCASAAAARSLPAPSSTRCSNAAEFGTRSSGRWCR